MCHASQGPHLQPLASLGRGLHTCQELHACQKLRTRLEGLHVCQAAAAGASSCVHRMWRKVCLTESGGHCAAGLCRFLTKTGGGPPPEWRELRPLLPAAAERALSLPQGPLVLALLFGAGCSSVCMCVCACVRVCCASLCARTQVWQTCCLSVSPPRPNRPRPQCMHML